MTQWQLDYDAAMREMDEWYPGGGEVDPPTTTSDLSWLVTLAPTVYAIITVMLILWTSTWEGR